MEKNKLLRKTISYHDYKEDFYPFLAGIFAGAGYMVESNKEHGAVSYTHLDVYKRQFFCYIN